MSPVDFKGSLEELKNKLLVNFDPLRFFVGDLEASIFTGLMLILKSLLSLLFTYIFFWHMQKEFSNMFKVWYDSLGGDAIGITWDRFSSKV